MFCGNHRSATDHKCTFDYRAEGARTLTRQLDVTGLVQKIDKI